MKDEINSWHCSHLNKLIEINVWDESHIRHKNNLSSITILARKSGRVRNE